MPLRPEPRSLATLIRPLVVSRNAVFRPKPTLLTNGDNTAKWMRYRRPVVQSDALTTAPWPIRGFIVIHPTTAQCVSASPSVYRPRIPSRPRSSLRTFSGRTTGPVTPCDAGEKLSPAPAQRQISVLEGNAADPKFAPDGKKLYYRIVKAVEILGTKRDPGEVWAADVESGHSERVTPGVEALEYDISSDGKHVVMDVPDSEGKSRIWLAPVDRSLPPRQVSDVGGQWPLFGPDDDIFFRRVEGASSFEYRMKPDGTGLRKALEQAVFVAGSISTDGRWIRIWAPYPGMVSAVTQLVPLGGGAAVVIGSNARVEWSSSGDCVWISSGVVPDGRTYIVPLQGRKLPRIPAGGFHSEAEVAALPGARRLDAEGAPGPSLGIYAFEHHTIQRNLYRVPIP